jgi:hypothetical protein
MKLLSKLLVLGSTLSLCLVLASCSGASGSTATTTPPAPDFALSASPATVALTAGGATQQITVTAAAVNGFTGTVAVSISGLPTGVTATPSTLTLAPGTPQTVTLTASASAPASSATITFTGTSSALTHTAAVSATISAAPQPDFSLSASPTTLTLAAGSTGTPITLTATPTNAFASPVAVSLSGLPTGITAAPSTLTLTPGTPQTLTLTALGTVASSTATITFTATSGSLTHTATLALTVQAATRTAAPDITTYHNDVARDGLNAQETILTQANVNTTQFGKIAFDTVDGKVDAQPLYLANVPIATALHNVLYVASEHGSLYAFDADTATQLWKTSLIPTAETASDTHGCGQITPEIGITATPVIDRALGTNGAIFAVATTKDATGNYHQRLHALDLTTGAELSPSPTEIAATYPGTGDNTNGTNVVFNPAQYAERAALLLLNGNLYTTWTSHCDAGLYTGWVIAYSESTLQQTQVLNLTPNGSKGSVWMAGDGPAADASGNIYLLDANGTFDPTLDANGFPSKGDYGNAMVKLSTTGKLAVADFFNTYDTVSESSQDEDFGSGGEILLPDQKDATGLVHRLIVGVGKDKNIYLADRDNMGKFSPSTTSPDLNIYQKVTGQIAGSVFATPAFFNNTLFYGGVGDHLRAFPITDAKLPAAPSSLSPNTFAFPGTTPAISANGTQNGIVWAVESGTGSLAVLHAFDPADLTHEFYNSSQAAASRDAFGNGNKYIAPLIVNGKVYVGTPTGVAVFGLLPH